MDKNIYPFPLSSDGNENLPWPAKGLYSREEEEQGTQPRSLGTVRVLDIHRAAAQHASMDVADTGDIHQKTAHFQTVFQFIHNLVANFQLNFILATAQSIFHYWFLDASPFNGLGI